MKILSLLALIISIGPWSNCLAESIPVTVQCNITGPIYSGTLDFEMNPNNWTVEKCEYGAALLLTPALSLSFNGIKYLSKSEKIRGVFKPDCTGEIVQFSTNIINAQNPDSGFGIALRLSYQSSVSSKSVAIEALQGCGIRLNQH